MKKNILIFLGFLSLLFNIGCSANNEWRDSQVLYSQNAFYQDKKIHLASNYAVGVCVPVNNKFQIMQVKHRLFKQDVMTVFDVKRNSKYYIINADRHTGKTIEQLRDSMFSTQKVDLSKHSKTMQDAINDCKVLPGMTKEEVILARGYPPVQETTSLDSNNWKYWYTRFRTGRVHFKDGKVSSVEGSIQFK